MNERQQTAQAWATKVHDYFAGLRKSPLYMIWYTATRVAVAFMLWHLYESTRELADTYRCLNSETTAYREEHTREIKDLYFMVLEGQTNLTGRVSETEREIEAQDIMRKADYNEHVLFRHEIRRLYRLHGLNEPREEGNQ